ncbi:MAG TPA: DMT family transporter [Steroidobacteraceae bacterium]|nr:DMT family transporter [Steroidobacteraceae bacterium]
MNLRTLMLFSVLCVFWGVPYFFIKLALVDVSPVCVAWGRITLGALVLIPVAWHRGTLMPVLRHKGAIVAFAVAELVIPFSMIAVAERWLTSSMTGVLIATVPLTVVLIAPLFGVHEAMSTRRLIGLVTGIAGVMVLLGFDTIAGSAQWLAVAGLILAVIGYAAGPLVVQRHLAGVDEIGAVAISLGLASVILLPVALATMPRQMPSALSLASIGILGLICTASAMLLYFYVIHAAGAARASVVAYISPAIAAVLGVVVLHEHFGIGLAAGLALILLGSALGSGGAEQSASLESSHNQ